ncbi:hypothetical protein PMZ80_007736 [Knufia obscura]|uniref:Heterokaryon incompatibility domain-containing protein n=1 Tax=Knufia obscura TaxID=1635080 RepID=A0ABR0RI60_9EURO|nr:hypothetical protein PMZ80_007736 [Knufia obscura]
MSTVKFEAIVPEAGASKRRSRIGSLLHKLTKPAEEPPYRPLPEYHIRVVDIKPVTTQHLLEVKLTVVDPRKFKYIALSYTWDQDVAGESDASHGLVGATQPILCGGTEVKISQNLYDALCQIRNVSSGVPVFVDALCINFDDNHERTNYLEIMGHIYSRAASVIVWLGKSESYTDEVMLIMRKLVNAIDWRRIGDGSSYNFRDPRFFTMVGIEPLTLKQWREIQAFCHLRWFTRYWAFFELALAKQALFLWGEACMEYNFLIDFGMILSLSGWLDELRQDTIDGIEEPIYGLTKMLGPVARLRSTPPWHPKHKEHASWMTENYQLETEQQHAWKFFEILLQSAEAFDCRDPRDIAYAPLALVRHVFGGQPINKQWPRPDYTRPADEVLRTFSNAVQQHTLQPSILATADETQQYQAQQPPAHVERGRSQRR